MNHEILAAKFFCVVALMLVAYLAACATNALLELATRAWRNRKGARNGNLW